MQGLNPGIRAEHVTHFKNSIFSVATRVYLQPESANLPPKLEVDRLVLSNGVKFDGSRSEGVSVYDPRRGFGESLWGVALLRSPTQADRSVTFSSLLPLPHPKIREIYRENVNREIRRAPMVEQMVKEDLSVVFTVDSSGFNYHIYRVEIAPNGRIQAFERNVNHNLGFDMPTQACFTMNKFRVGVGLDEVEFPRLVSSRYFS